MSVIYGAEGEEDEVVFSEPRKKIGLQSLATYMAHVIDNRMEGLPENLGSRLRRAVELLQEDIREKEKEEGGEGKKRTRKLAWITKALTMELLAGHMIEQMDSPLESRVNCVVRNGKACHFSQGGKPDITVKFTEHYKINVEVSSKEHMSSTAFKKQLDGALKHMQQNGAQKTLLVTEWGMDKWEAGELLEGCMKEHRKNLLEGQEIILISAYDFALIASWLRSLGVDKQGRRFPSDRMPEVFEALAEGAEEGRSPVDTWSEQVEDWVKSLDRPSTPPPPEPPPEPPDKPPEPEPF